jgi:hypothetical protein
MVKALPREDLLLTDRLEAMIERHSALLEHDVSQNHRGSGSLPLVSIVQDGYYDDDLEVSHVLHHSQSSLSRACLSAFQCVLRAHTHLSSCWCVCARARVQLSAGLVPSTSAVRRFLQCCLRKGEGNKKKNNDRTTT